MKYLCASSDFSGASKLHKDA